MFLTRAQKTALILGFIMVLMTAIIALFLAQ